MDTHRFLASPWAVYAATLLSALPLAAVVAVTNPQPEGACSGIGFGCSLYGWDAAAFLLIFLGLPYIVGLAVLLGLLALLPPRLAAVRTGVAWTGLAVPWVLVAFGLVSRP